MKSLPKRLTGFAFLSLALAPPVIVGVALVLTVKLTFDVVRVSREKATEIARTIDEQIYPQLAAIQGRYTDLAENAERLGSGIRQVFVTLGNIQDIQVQRGQFGSTQELNLRIPERRVNAGPFSIDNGQLFNERIPGIPIPVQPITIPVTPLRQAFAPLSQNGVVARAVQTSTARLQETVGEVKKLGQPLAELKNTTVGWVQPLKDIGTRFSTLVVVAVAALAVVALLYMAAAVYAAVARRLDAAAAFRMGGPLGYMRFVHGFLLIDGFSRLFGREAPIARAPSIQDLAMTVTRLQAEIEMLRAERSHPHALAAVT